MFNAFFIFIFISEALINYNIWVSLSAHICMKEFAVLWMNVNFLQGPSMKERNDSILNQIHKWFYAACVFGNVASKIMSKRENMQVEKENNASQC